jgi:hypothetical protein
MYARIGVSATAFFLRLQSRRGILDQNCTRTPRLLSPRRTPVLIAAEARRQEQYHYQPCNESAALVFQRSYHSIEIRGLLLHKISISAEESGLHQFPHQRKSER